MYDRINAREHIRPPRAVAQIRVDKGRFAGKESWMFRVRTMYLRQERIHDMRANETCSTGDENSLLHLPLLR